MAGHLENFVTTHIPVDRKLTFIGISYGFQIVTAMLDQAPDIGARTEHAISFVGFVRYSDFAMPLSYKVFLLHLGANPARRRIGAQVFRAGLRPGVLRMIFFFNRPFNLKFKNFNKAEARQYVDEQIWLWMINDHRTHGATAWDFFKKNDLTALRLPVDAIHIGVPNDHLINNKAVTSELTDMFRSLEVFELNLANHAPLDIDSPEKVLQLLPEGLISIFEVSANVSAITEAVAV
jgi:pimeloyl-ACP methyl ester carboxylesterase